MFLNGSGTTEIQVYIHNKNQMYFPTKKMLYGSNSFVVSYSLRKPAKETMVYKMSRVANWAVDSPDERCDEENAERDLTGCIARFVESKFGCRSYIARKYYIG